MRAPCVVALNALTEFKLPVMICSVLLVIIGTFILHRRGAPLASRLYDHLHRQG